jgi:translation initiation factor IF-2
MGPVAWVLVQTGTLRVGDVFLAGECYGRVRALQDSRGSSVSEAGPSTPVVVTGFNAPPEAGTSFVVLQDERVARAIAEKRATLSKQRQGPAARHITLEDFHERMLAGEKKQLNVVIKADVQGSVAVLQTSLAKLGNETVRVSIVHGGVGGINESDVLLASASDAVVIGFHVTASGKIQKIAEQEGVDIRTYRVIYEAINDVHSALEGMLAPEMRETVIGHAEIRQIFRSSAVGNIAGCYVQDGEIVRGSPARLSRDGVIVYEGKLQTLRRVKDDVRSVVAGLECGIKIENFDDIKVGDIIEVYQIESVAQALA